MALVAGARSVRSGQNAMAALWRATACRSSCVAAGAAGGAAADPAPAAGSGSGRVASTPRASSGFLNREFAFAAISTVVGAAAFAAWQLGTVPELSLSEAAERSALHPSEWRNFKLVHTQRVSPDTRLYRFEFDPNERLGLSVASCLLTRAPIGTGRDGNPSYVVRPYTPVSPPDSKGYFDLIVKTYPQGKMSQHFASLKNGDTLEVKGPIPKLPYSPNMKKQIGMIAGGTGITPMKQIIDEILKNPDDDTQVFLLYGSVSPDDVLLKDELDRLAASHPNFKVYYYVDKADDKWIGGKGYFTLDAIKKGLPSPGDDTLILVCGPPGMMKHVSGDKASNRSQGKLSGLLAAAGYNEDQVFKF